MLANGARIAPTRPSSYIEKAKGVDNHVSAVLVGDAPCLQEVLYGGLAAPFDFDSFMAFARKNLFEENINFYVEIDSFKSQPMDKRIYAEEARRIVSEYINEGSPQQVNLSSARRRTCETRVAASVKVAEMGFDIDISIFDDPQKDVLLVIERDQYALYINRVVLQRRLRLAQEEALWWRKEGLTCSRFFTFPNPVNTAESRLHNGSSCFLLTGGLALAYFHGHLFLLVYLVYGFVARVSCGPRLDPQAFIVLFVLRPLIVERLGLLPDKFVSSKPKRFAQTLGGIFSILLLAFAAADIWTAALVVAAMFFCAAAPAFLFDFCIGCQIFQFCAGRGWLGPTACDECNLAYIERQPSRMSPSSAQGDRGSIHSGGGGGASMFRVSSGQRSSFAGGPTSGRASFAGPGSGPQSSSAGSPRSSLPGSPQSSLAGSSRSSFAGTSPGPQLSSGGAASVTRNSSSVGTTAAVAAQWPSAFGPTPLQWSSAASGPGGLPPLRASSLGPPLPAPPEPPPVVASELRSSASPKGDGGDGGGSGLVGGTTSIKSFDEDFNVDDELPEDSYELIPI